MECMRKLVLVTLALSSFGIGGCDYFRDAHDRLERAQEFAGKGDRRRALVEVRIALQEEPGLAPARLLLAELAWWLGDVRSSARELEKVPADFNPAQRNDLATRIAIASGEFDRALVLVDGMSEGASRALYRGQALFGLNRAPEAEAQFRVALQGDPSSVEAHTALIEARAAQGDTAGALEASAALVKSHGDAAMAWFVHGALLAREAKLAESARALTTAREFASRQLTVMQQVALLSLSIDVQLALRDHDAARVSNAALARLVGGSPLSALATARIAMSAGDYAAAVTELRKVTTAAPQMARARFLLGVALAAQGNLEQASSELNSVVRQSPENMEARELQARLRMRLDDPDGALRALMPALQAQSGDLRLASLADQLLAQSDGNPQAIGTLEAALKTTPDDRELQLRLVRTYLQAGKPEPALQWLGRMESVAGDPRRDALLLQATFLASGDAAARRELANLLERAGNDTARIILVAAFHLRLGETAQGRQVLQAALARSADDNDLSIALAKLEFSANQPAAARALLAKLIDRTPGHEGARMVSAQLAMAGGDRAAAAEHLESVRKTNPGSVPPRLALAQLALARDDIKTAGALVQEVLAAEPDNGAVRNSLGLLFLTTARYDKAAEHFRAGTELDPTSAVLWLNLGRAQLAQQQFSIAQGSLERALKLRPAWVQAESALVFLDLQAGSQEKALRRIADLRQARPRDPEVMAVEGDLRAALAQHREAAAAYDQAFDLAPTFALALRSTSARSAAKLPDPASALTRWVTRHPDDAGARVALAEALMRDGDQVRAAEQLRAVLAKRPQDVTALNNLAWLYHELGDPRALGLARQAAALAPNVPQVADTLGWILVEQGQASEGVQLLERAAGSRSASPSIHYHYGAALARTGATDRARQLLTELLANEASFPERTAAAGLLADLSKGDGSGK